MLDGTDVTSNFDVFTNQAVLKAGSSFDVPVVDNLISIKIYLEESGTDSPLSTEKTIEYRAVTEENKPFLTTGDFFFIHGKEYLLPIKGKNLSDVNQVEVVKSYTPDTVDATFDVVDYQVIDGIETIFILFKDLNFNSNYRFRVGGEVQTGLNVKVSRLGEGYTREFIASYLDYYVEDGITITGPTVRADDAMHIAGKWGSVSGFIDKEIRDSIIVVNGKTVHGSNFIGTGTNSFIFGGLHFNEDENTVEVKINKTANGWENTASFTVFSDLNEGLTPSAQGSPITLNFEPSEPCTWP